MGVVQVSQAQSSFDGYVGEAGTIETPVNGGWERINFERTYENPIVVGTTNTDNTGSGLIFEARNVSSSSAEVRICKSQGQDADGCDPDPTGDETVGYLVIDAQAANSSNISGVEAGSFQIDGEFTSTAQTVTYDKSFGSAPHVFTAVQTVNGTAAIETRVSNYSSTDFTAGLCEHQTGNNDNCDGGHVTETVGWVTIEPGNLPWNETAETDIVTNISSSNWASVSFTESYTNNPVLLAENVTENGGQESQIDEARNVSTSGGEVRYCEIEGTDNCNGHTGEDIVWSAITTGSLSVGDPTAGAGGMSSGSYAVAQDSLNSGGRDQLSSSNYQVADTVGEQATGRSTSSNYTMQAGYRQMDDSSISITAVSNVDMGSLAGLSQDAAEGTPNWTVTTDNPSGYQVSVKTNADPAMQHTSKNGSFSDYDAGSSPDYNFSVASSESAFGFSPEGADITDAFRDNGSSCGTGSQDTQSACWRGFRETDRTVARANDNNQPSGTDTTLRIRAENGSDNLQPSGSYQTQITVTAISI